MHGHVHRQSARGGIKGACLKTSAGTPPFAVVLVMASFIGFASDAVAQKAEAAQPDPDGGAAETTLRPVADDNERSLSSIVRGRRGIGRDGSGLPRWAKPRVEDGPERVESRSTSGPSGPVYVWRDGDRTLRVYLQEDLVVLPGGAAAAGDDVPGRVVAGTGDGLIVSVAEVVADGGERRGQPVFRSESGALMTLPGGVVLILESGYTEAQARAFFDAQGIGPDRVSPLGPLPNAFVVEAPPGFPSLELANSLAGLEGVEVSVPDWWRETAVR